MKKINEKYVSLLQRTYEKYRHIETLETTSTHTSVGAVSAGGNESSVAAEAIEGNIGPNMSKKKPHNLVHMKDVPKCQSHKEYKARKSGSRRPFLGYEDELLLRILQETPNGEKVKYSKVSELVKVLKRNDNSIVGRLEQLRRGRHLTRRKSFSLHEDKLIIDEAFEKLRETKSLQKTVLSNSKKLGSTFNRNHWSVDLRWNTQIKTWLLQYYHKTLNLEIRPMLANILADNFDSYKSVNWKFVLKFPELKGHTEESLRLIFYTKMLFYTARNLKLKRSQITLRQVALETERMCLVKRANKVLEKRQADLIDYFEKLIKMHSLEDFLE